jgi:hypothetical protein
MSGSRASSLPLQVYIRFKDGEMMFVNKEGEVESNFLTKRTG